MSGDKSLASRTESSLYAISIDREEGTVDILVFDHKGRHGAWLYLPPELALQMADTIAHHARLLSE